MTIRGNKKMLALIVDLEGEIDQLGAQNIREKIDRELMPGGFKNIVFNFENVSFMDSSGIGMVMGRYKMLRALGGKVAIASPSSGIKRIIELSGASKFVPVYLSVKDALKSFKEGDM